MNTLWLMRPKHPAAAGRAFTLIELLAVVVIIAMLAAMIFPGILHQ
jgi:prepilin-type N-terminal cleavage/methylation domain-containing protein